MWNRRNEERGSGGPVLRDPLANRNRPQPYVPDFKNRQHDNGNHHNFNRNFGNTNQFTGDQSKFPPALDEAFFPPPPAPFFQKPIQPAQIPLGSLLGSYPASEPHLNANARGNEPAVPRFHGFPVRSQHGVANQLESNSIGIQNIHATPPSSLLPLLQAVPNPVQSLLLLSGTVGPGPSQHLDSNNFGVGRQPESLDLRPQWSTQNDDFFDNNQESSNDSPQNEKQVFGFERRQFNNKTQQQNSGDWAPGSSFEQTLVERRPFNNKTQQQNSSDWAPGSGSPFDQTGFDRRPFNSKTQQQNSGDWAPGSSFEQTLVERRPFNNKTQQQNSSDWAPGSGSPFDQTGFERRPFNSKTQQQNSGDWAPGSSFEQTLVERRPFLNKTQQQNSSDWTSGASFDQTGFERRPFNSKTQQQNSSDWAPGSSFDQTGFERRPFNNKFQQQNNDNWASGSGSPFDQSDNSSFSNNFEQRPNINLLDTAASHNQQLQPQQSTYTGFNKPKQPPKLTKFWESILQNETSFSGQRPGNGNNQPNFNRNTQLPMPPESQQQNHIPSLLSLNQQFPFNSSNNNTNARQNFGSKKGQQFNQKFQKKPILPSSGPKQSSFQSNGNSKPKSGPLLPTPKLIPYPPPPLNPKSSNVSPTPLLRNPRGILKNASTSDYSNSGYSKFVKEGTSSPSPSSSVVPYAVHDDDDDDEDIEFVSEVENAGNSSSSMLHDFFSEKMVQHFMSTLNGKPLEEQLDELLKYLVLPPDFLATRVSIVRNLHLMLRETFKKCILHPYGADFVGVGNSDDSVNVFVDLTGKQGPLSQVDSALIEQSEVTKENLDELLNLIQEDKNHKFFGQIVRRTNFSFNRINLPVISFIHSETKVRCNLRLDNYMVVQEAKVIQFVCSLDTRIPSLLSLARYWSSVHKVLDTPEEDTKNRFVTLLMIFFLARKKIIPTMADLQSLSVKREFFNNVDIGFCDDYSLVPQNENPALEDKTVFTLSCLALLKEFFKLFAEAKLKDDVVSLWKAEFIPKENFSPSVEGRLLTPELRKRYKFGANGKMRNKRIDCGSRLCIQDFQDLTENLSLSVAEYDVSKFQVECEEASKKIEGIMLSGAGNLMDLFVVSDYASYGTPEHTSMHKIVYLLNSIADERNERITGMQQSSSQDPSPDKS